MFKRKKTAASQVDQYQGDALAHPLFAQLVETIETTVEGPVYPMNDTYCSVHSGPGLGGWTCQHLECRKSEE